jgi:putative endonuclease
MAWVYILECNDGSYYVGSTTALEIRLRQHEEGLGAAYTRRRRPVRLVWSVEFDRVDEAFAFEKRVQGWSRAKRRALIEGRLGDLGWLSSRSHASRNRREGLPERTRGFETVAERPPQPPDPRPTTTTGG